MYKQNIFGSSLNSKNKFEAFFRLKVLYNCDITMFFGGFSGMDEKEGDDSLVDVYQGFHK